MKLKRLRVLPSVKLAGRVSSELNETLPAYQGYYRHLHGEAIEPWPLVVQMLEMFVNSDPRVSGVARAIQQSPGRTGAGQDWSTNGVAEWLGSGQSDSCRKIKQNQSRHSSGGEIRRIALARG
jgi:hypothetical protein